MTKRFFVYSIFLLIHCLLLKAQDYRFENYSHFDGLTHNSIYSISQDKKGFIWIGTYDGCNRFDGYTFTNYHPINTDSNSINAVTIHSMLCDHDGDMWFAEKKISLYDHSTERFHTITNHEYSEEEANVLEYEIKHMSSDSRGYVWFRPDDYSKNSILFIDKKNKKVQKLIVPELKYFNKRVSYRIDTKDRLWIFNKVDHNSTSCIIACIYLNSFHLEGKLKIELFDIPLYGKDKKLTLVSNEKENIKFIINDTAFIYNNRNKKFQTDTLLTTILSKIEWPVNSVLYDSKGNYWLANNLNILYCYSSSTKFKDYSFNTNRQIAHMIEDKYGCIWITTNLGLQKVNLNQKPFEITNKYADGSLFNDVIMCLYQDKNKRVLLAMDNSLHILSQSDNTIQKLDPTGLPKHIYYKAVKSMCDYEGDFLLLGNIGLNKLDFQQHAYQYAHPSDNDSGSISTWVNWAMIHAKKTNEYWFGGNDGLNRIVNPLNNPSNKYGKMQEKFKRYNYQKDDSFSIASHHIWAIYEDSNGDIWFGTRNGLSKYNREKDNFINYRFKFGDKHSISHPKVSCIFEDSKKRFWIGTEGGLNMMDREKGTFINYHISDGLPSALIWGMMEDSKGYLWLSTGNGICRFDVENKQFRNYGISDGLPEMLEGLRGAYLKTIEGKIFIGTNKGLVSFYPDSIRDNTSLPDVYITAISLFNKPVLVGEKINGDIILNQSIQQNNSINLSHKNRILTIHFVGIHTADPKRHRYKYILEGLDDTWTETSSDKRFAHYTGLPPGKYTFRVKVCNSDGFWNESGISELFITIRPPWWATWTFRIIILMLIVGGSLIYFQYRLRLVESQKRKLQELVDEQTSEITQKAEILKTVNSELQETNVLLEERQEEIIVQKEELEHQAKELLKANATKDRFFSIIAHDLKNPMFAMKGLAEILKENGLNYNKMQLEEIYEMLYKGSKNVSDLLEELLTWARTQSGKVEVKKEHIHLNQIIDDTLGLLKINADQKNLYLRSELSSPIHAYADKNMVTTVVRNIVNNAIKFTNTGGITLRASQTDNEVEIVIEDTGVGMSEKTKEKLFRIDVVHTSEGTSGESGTGLGLIICKEFVEINKGHIWVESEEKKGSRFIFTLPVSELELEFQISN